MGYVQTCLFYLF